MCYSGPGQGDLAHLSTSERRSETESFLSRHSFSMTKHSGKGPNGIGSSRPEKSFADRLTMWWVVVLVICPVSGWFITILHGVVTMDNWRSMMIGRIGVCLLLPLALGIASYVVKRMEVGASGIGRNMVYGYLLFSCIGIWPAITAFRDLRGEVETVQLTVAEREATRHRKKTQRYTDYDLTLSDGSSYNIDQEEFTSVRVGDTCTIYRLPHTDILLSVRPLP